MTTFAVRLALALILIGAGFLAGQAICLAFIHNRHEQRLAREAEDYLRKVWSQR